MEGLRPYDPLPAAIEHNGISYELDLSYAAVFAATDALQDARLDDLTRLRAALSLLVEGPQPPDDPELLGAIVALIRDENRHDTGPKTLDIVQDWPYICAAFQQAYGIDLYEDKSLHIIRFRALLQAIPKDTKLAEIVGIRGAKIPKPTKYNQEQIADLTRLKSIYALRGSASTLQDGWAKLANTLIARAEHGSRGRVG